MRALTVLMQHHPSIRLALAFAPVRTAFDGALDKSRLLQLCLRPAYKERRMFIFGARTAVQSLYGPGQPLFSYARTHRPYPRIGHDRRKPLARYGAMESALASGLLRPTYTTSWDTTPQDPAKSKLPNRVAPG